MTEKIYILALEERCFYVGRTKNLDKRIKDHFSNKGSAWTIAHKPLDVIRIQNCTKPEDEDAWTKYMMRQYSVHQVRGGSYCQVSLGQGVTEFLKKEINHNKGACFICGKKDHFARQCKEKLQFREINFQTKHPKKQLPTRPKRCQSQRHRVVVSTQRNQIIFSEDQDSDSYYDSNESSYEIEMDEFNSYMERLHIQQEEQWDERDQSVQWSSDSDSSEEYDQQDESEESQQYSDDFEEY